MREASLQRFLRVGFNEGSKVRTTEADSSSQPDAGDSRFEPGSVIVDIKRAHSKNVRGLRDCQKLVVQSGRRRKVCFDHSVFSVNFCVGFLSTERWSVGGSKEGEAPLYTYKIPQF